MFVFFFLYRKVHKFISNLSTVNRVQMIQDCLKVSLLFARSIGWRLCDMQDTCCEDESSGRDQQEDCRIWRTCEWIHFIWISQTIALWLQCEYFSVYPGCQKAARSWIFLITYSCSMISKGSKWADLWPYVRYACTMRSKLPLSIRLASSLDV